MRCNPSNWLLGLVPIALLSWIAVQLEHEGIEADLGRRTQDALGRAGYDWAVTNFSGRDAILTGRAANEGDPVSALRKVQDTWGVRIGQGRTELLEFVENFTWSATNEGDGHVVLAGYVPGEEARSAVVDAARASFPKLEVFDQMKLARGAPDQDAWLSGAMFGLKQIAQLKKGTAGLDGLGLSVVGEAPTVAAFRTVISQLKTAMPDGVKLAFEKITAPVIDPYIWTAKWASNQVTINGYMPEETVRQKLIADAKKIFGTAVISDKTEIAGGAPENWPRAAVLALSQLAALKTGTADIKGSTLTIVGEAANETVANAVRKSLVGDKPANFKTADQIKYPKPAPLPAGVGYVMAIAHDGSAIEVTGYVPSEAARAALIDAVKARFPGQTVTDRTQVAAGAPDGWQQCIVAGLGALPKLKTGKTVLVDRQLSVTGNTDDYGTWQSLPGDIKAAAGQTCIATADIAFTGVKRTDLSWRAAHGSDGQVLLAGDVPDETSRARLLEAAQRLFPRARISDTMTVAPAPSDPWLTVALRGLDYLAQLKTGEAALKATALSVSGTAVTEQIKAGIKSELSSSLPDGFTGSDAIEVIAPDPRQDAADKCSELLNDATARGVLQFARAKADLTPESTDTLKELAEIANACPGFRIEIEGHTDAEGTDERNQRLSDRRARAVADFLARSGVDKNRLNTVGYGSSRPLADNSSEEGRAKNRRIEFLVKTN